jgi:predicted nicotinamide N-methyase
MGFLPFQTALRELRIGPLQVQLQCVTNIDELIDNFLMQSPDSEAVRDEQIPYWASLWPSAMGMAQYLVLSGLARPGMRVTEIGCGLGLPGIVAGMLGAEVLLTDYLPEPLELAAANWSLNCPTPPRTALLDWRNPESQYAADLLLASDVAYEARSFEPLPQAFRSLCKPGGTVLVSEPDRSFARRFFDTLPRQGFEVHSHTETVELDGQQLGIRLHRLS